MIISCTKASELVEKKNIGCISKYENVKLKIHLFQCRLCKAYAFQSKFIEDALKRLPIYSKKYKMKQSIKDRWIKEFQK